jgi:DNA repair protein RadA/Sms
LGELRTVVGLERRLREAARLGFTTAIVPRPAGAASIAPIDGLAVVPVGTLRDAIEAALTDRPPARGEAVPAMLG